MALGQLWAGYGEVDERVGEDFRVGGLDELVDFWGCLLEDERPEVGDFGDGFGALGEGGLRELVVVAD